MQALPMQFLLEVPPPQGVDAEQPHGKRSARLRSQGSPSNT